MFLAKDKGITLVSLVITIIIMLILAGVSLSMVTGDSSVLGQAKKTAFMQEIAGYKEELAISFLGDAARAQKKIDKATITVRDEAGLRKYIPSIKDEDLDDYMIIAGELYYVGDDSFEISVCNEQGYITKPEDMTAEEFADSLETKALEAIVLQMAGGEKFMTTKNDGTVEEAGEPLAKKTSGQGFGSTSVWKIIVEVENKETKATYADGWYFVEAGTTVKNLGTLKYSYIINYSTKKAVRFDSTKHTILTSTGSLAVQDNLAFNADPGSMDGSTESWGDAKLYGFSGNVVDGSNNVISGWTKDAFVTDGEDDYVELKGGTHDFSNGYTVECFVRIPNAYANNQESHVFAKGVDYSNAISLGIWGPQVASSGWGNTIWFGYQGHRSWNTDISKLNNKDIYIVVKGDSTNPKGECYIDNVKQTIRHQGSNTWAKYLSILNDANKGFIFGKGTDATGVNYTKLHLYSLRVYTRNLTQDEMLANYNATIAYHDILKKGGNADNNNTGGSDLEDVIKGEN